MPQQHVLAIEAVPVVQVPLLPRLAAQAAPHDAVADAELARQRRPRRRVTKRIGRVEHTSPFPPRPYRVCSPPHEKTSTSPRCAETDASGAPLTPPTTP